MLDATGWTLPSLLVQRGADTGYRVTVEGGHVRLEGRRGSQSCTLRSESPAVTARHLLGTYIAFASTPSKHPGPALLAATAPAPYG